MEVFALGIVPHFEYHGREFFPGLSFREDGVAERPSAITALLRIADLED